MKERDKEWTTNFKVYKQHYTIKQIWLNPIIQIQKIMLWTVLERFYNPV